MNMRAARVVSILQERRIRQLIRRAFESDEGFGCVYENSDTDDIDGRVIHNLTITWKGREEEDGDPE